MKFCISYLFALILNVKQFYLNHRQEPINCYHSGLEWKQWQRRSTLHSPNLQGWSRAISLFNVISRTLVIGESYPSEEIQSVYSKIPVDWAEYGKFVSLFVWGLWHINL